MKVLVIILIFLGVAACVDEVAPPLASSGQPTPAELGARAEAGVKTVIDLRTKEEPRGFDEPAVVEGLGMRYESLPIGSEDDLSAANVAALKALIDASDGPVLVHCASGNRVGALFALVARSDGASVEESIAYGKKLGLSSLEPVVRERLANGAAESDGAAVSGESER